MATQLVKRFLGYRKTRMLTSSFTRARHLTLLTATLPPYFFHIQFNIILRSNSRSFRYSFPFKVSDSSLFPHLSSRIPAPRFAKLILLDLALVITPGEDYALWSFSSCSFPRCSRTPSLSYHNVLSTLFSDNFKLCSSKY